MDRFAVKRVRCLKCKHEQDVSNTCEQCGLKFGEYFCGICNLYDYDTSKKQFHCEGCGICRVGGRENFFHCNKCACCMAMSTKEKHEKSCTLQDVLKQSCPICMYDMHSSRDAAHFLKCGHALHSKCFQQLAQSSF